MIREVGKNIFVVDDELSLMGSKVGIRMTIVRLASGDLMVISPVALNQGLKKEIDALGKVEYIVAPNKFHHLFVDHFSKQYPRASVYVARGLSKRIPDIKYDVELGGEVPEAWKEDMETLLFDAMPALNETVFLHKPSRTLIVTDLSFNIQRANWSLWGIYVRLSGAYRRFGLSRIVKFAVRDKKRARQLIDTILDWDFDRIIVAHGDVVESGGREKLHLAFAWLK